MAKITPGNTKRLTDFELVTLVQSGSSTAFSTLTERYTPLLLSRAARYSNVAGAGPEDFLQEGLLALYRAAKTYALEKSRFSTYATTCIENAMTDAFRRFTRVSHPNTVYLNDFGEIALQREVADLAQAALPEDIYDNGEQSKDWMRQIEDKLSIFERQVLALYLKGYTYQQTAVVVKSSPKAVDNALQRVRRKLRPSAAG